MRVAVFAMAAAAAAGTGCATLPLCPARGGPPWYAYSSPHFDLRTDMERKDAENVVRTLEETRAAMLAMVWAGAPEPPARTQVIALASGLAFAVFAGSGILGMYFHEAPFPPTTAIAGSGFRPTETVNHELAHDLSSWFLPLQPTWYSEGIATFLETVRYDRKEGRAYVGEASQERFWEIQRRGLLKVERLLEGGPDDVFGGRAFATSSWILVHYLLNHKAEAFARFQTRLRAMEPARQAWLAEFPDLDSETLQETLNQYASVHGRFVVSTFTLPPWQGQTDIRPMSDAEVHGVRAYLYSYLRPIGGKTKPAEASAEIDEAMSVERAPIDALAVAFYARDVKDKVVRSGLARRAVDSHPESWMAWLMVADATDRGDPAHQTALTRALVRAPDEPEVLARLSILKATQGKWDEALAFSNKALRNRVVRLDLWIVHLTALAKTGRCAEAELWATAVMRYVSAGHAQVVGKRWNELRQTCAPVARPDPVGAAR